MKADILRRAEEAQYEDDEDEDLDPYGGDTKGKARGKDVAFEEEIDDDISVEGGGRLKVRDGEATDDEGSEEDSEGDGDDEEGEGTEVNKYDIDCASSYTRRKTKCQLTLILQTPKGPETILELAYIRDPKLFDRDGQTRRGKARAELKTQTGTSTILR